MLTGAELVALHIPLHRNSRSKSQDPNIQVDPAEDREWTEATPASRRVLRGWLMETVQIVGFGIIIFRKHKSIPREDSKLLPGLF